MKSLTKLKMYIGLLNVKSSCFGSWVIDIIIILDFFNQRYRLCIIIYYISLLYSPTQNSKCTNFWLFNLYLFYLQMTGNDPNFSL